MFDFLFFYLMLLLCFFLPPVLSIPHGRGPFVVAYRFVSFADTDMSHGCNTVWMSFFSS